MPEIKVDRIVNRNNNGAPELSKGASIPSGKVITGGGGINVTGIVTASSFSGSGSGLTNLSIATQGKAIALKIIFGPENNFRA
jgi:hypothetical protein